MVENIEYIVDWHLCTIQSVQSYIHMVRIEEYGKSYLIHVVFAGRIQAFELTTMFTDTEILTKLQRNNNNNIVMASRKECK